MLLQQREIGKKKQQPLRILLYVPLPVSGLLDLFRFASPAT
jgi:hypothetical protein